VTPISPPPVTAREPDYLPAYLSNGLIGLRVPPIALLRNVVVVSGSAGTHPTARVEAVPYAPDPLAGDIRLKGVFMTDALEAVAFVEQRYDFSCGELTTRFDYEIDGVTAHVTVVTFCSRTQPTIVAQETTVELDGDCDLEMHALVDPHAIAGRFAERNGVIPGEEGSRVDGAMRWATLGEESSIGLAYATEFHGGDAERHTVVWDEQSPLRTSYALRGRARDRYVLRQLGSVIPSSVHAQPDRAATRSVARAVECGGFDSLRSDNRRVWADIWRGRPVLVGADGNWQALVDAAYFYLHTSTHSSSIASTHIFGLAQWKDYHYYYGHVMWDVENFAVPVLTLTQPEAARAILDYRTRSLESARGNARLNGYRGLQFPWESGPARGEEAAPGDGLGAAFEHHVSMTVAHAFAQFGFATGDDFFTREQVWPVVHGVAEWIESRVVETPRGYEITSAMGIAERKEPSDNNAYVNMAASVALRDAIAVADQVGARAKPAWADIAERLVIPRNSNGVVVDHDGYRRGMEKGATPAALAGIFPFGYELDADTEAKTIRFWLDQAEEYIGSPMLSALYGAWAARIGERKLATQLFDEGYAQFCSPRFHNVHEWRQDKGDAEEMPAAGPFLANLAGFLLSIVQGLLGVRIGPGDPQTWLQRPVAMPDAWDGVEIERVWVHGTPMSLRGTHGDTAATLAPSD
jgi:trehalose/maltose hydrolase-like predicted phosphorylase